MSEEISQANKWEKTYLSGFQLLKKHKFAESRNALKKALELADDDESRVEKSNEALALLACAEGMAVERKLQVNLDQARNTYLYGIVIVILAVFILSLLLRFGPQKPEVVSRFEDWVLEAKRKNETAASQTASLILAVFIFALVAFGLMIVLIAFMWSLTIFSGPKDGHFKEADSYYNEAIKYLSATRRGKENLNKSDVVKYYNQVFKFRKKGSRKQTAK